MLSTSQKVGRISVYTAAFGIMTRVPLIIFHQRHMGHLIINGSSILLIVGITAIFFFPSKNDDPAVNIYPRKITRAFRIMFYLSLVGIVVGEMLRLNRYPGGSRVFFSGAGALVVTMLAALALKRITDKKRII